MLHSAGLQDIGTNAGFLLIFLTEPALSGVEWDNPDKSGQAGLAGFLFLPQESTEKIKNNNNPAKIPAGLNGVVYN